MLVFGNDFLNLLSSLVIIFPDLEATSKLQLLIPELPLTLRFSCLACACGHAKRWPE